MLYHYRVHEILRVVDGDTVDVMIDLGFDTFTKQRIRLWGVDAPEVRTRDLEEKARGQESKLWLEHKLATGQITIETKKDKKGSFGRMLGIFFVDDRNINYQMIDEGFATEYTK